MKKQLICLLLALTMLMSLAACGKKDTTNDDNNQNEDNKGFQAEVIKADQIKPRDVVVDYMYKMANIKWTPKEKIDFSKEIIPTLIYEPGQEYYGVMYVTGAACAKNYEEFMSKLDENGVYIGPTDRTNAWGNHCSSALIVSYDLISNDISFTSTVTMFPTRNKGTIPVGDYVIGENDTMTKEVIAKNDLTTMCEAYALLQKGDAILNNWDTTGHTRMIISVDVKKTSGGKINPGASSVTTIEQTSSFDKTDKANGRNTTWFVEHVYTFRDLYNSNYIPLTIAALDTKDAQDTEFTTKSIDKGDTITSGKLKGIVRSSYAPISSVTVELADADGKLIATETYKRKGSDTKVFQFSNVDAPKEFTTLTKGDYVYTVIANTVYGSAKIYQLEFSVE